MRAIEEQLEGMPEGLSFFDPFLRHEVKEALEAGGEAFVSRDAQENVNGLFIYDSYEATVIVCCKDRNLLSVQSTRRLSDPRHLASLRYGQGDVTLKRRTDFPEA